MTSEQKVEGLMAAFGIDRRQAEFIAAVDSGQVEGDVQTVPDLGPQLDPRIAKRLGLKGRKA